MSSTKNRKIPDLMIVQWHSPQKIYIKSIKHTKSQRNQFFTRFESSPTYFEIYSRMLSACYLHKMNSYYLKHTSVCEMTFGWLGAERACLKTEKVDCKWGVNNWPSWFEDNLSLLFTVRIYITLLMGDTVTVTPIFLFGPSYITKMALWLFFMVVFIWTPSSEQTSRERKAQQFIFLGCRSVKNQILSLLGKRWFTA